MPASHTFAKRAFQGAAVYGLLALVPQYFLEEKLNADFPPAITHPEHFYGFIGVAVAWQIAFLVIASDVVRFRPLMLVALIEKLSFGVAAIALFAAGRVPGAVLGFGIVDLCLGAMFVAAWRATASAATEPRNP